MLSRAQVHKDKRLSDYFGFPVSVATPQLHDVVCCLLSEEQTISLSVAAVSQAQFNELQVQIDAVIRRRPLVCDAGTLWTRPE